MRKYLIILLCVTLILVSVALALMKVGNEYYQMIMPVIPLYFALVTGIEHWAVVESMRKSPRTFVKNFLGITVAVLFVHLLVLSVWMFTHASEAKGFALAFCICYVTYLIFETVALAMLVRETAKKNEEAKKNFVE